MLKQVEMKSRPHPERPDRLRAIAASLATSGVLFNFSHCFYFIFSELIYFLYLHSCFLLRDLVLLRW